MPKFKKKYERNFSVLDKLKFNTISLQYLVQHNNRPRLTEKFLEKLIS